MDSQDTAHSITEPASGDGTMVKPNVPLPAQGFQARPQGPAASPRNSINNGPVGAPRQGQPLRRLDSRSSLGPPAAGQFVQLRPYGPPRPPGGSLPPRPPQPGGQQPPPTQNPALHPAAGPRFAHSPGIIRGAPPPQQRPPFPAGNYQQAYPVQPQQQQVQPRLNNDPRFQRPPPPDIATQQQQNGPPPPRNAEASPRPPGGQDAHPPRQLLRNDSLLSLQRQQLLSNIEDIKQQPTRPRIVIERMADINESGDDVVANKPESYLQRKRSDVRENGENDDDDDVVMDNEKSPRHDANGIHPPEALMNGSKSPSTPRKQDTPSRPMSAMSDDKSRHSADDSAAIMSQSRPPSAVSGYKDEGKEEKFPSRPPSSAEDLMRDSPAKIGGLTSPLLEDSKSNKTSSRPPSATSIGATEEAKQPPPSSPYGNTENTLKTPSKSSDNSRSSTPSHLETLQHAEREAKSPSKTPDKSRSSTPAVLEPPQSARPESRSPSKSPDKSRGSTPAELAPSPAKTPDRSRSVTPAGSVAEPSNDEAERRSTSPDHRDEDTLQVKQPSRPASSLGSSPNLMAGRDSKSPPKSPRSPRSPTTPDSQGKLSVPGSASTLSKSPEEAVKGFDNGRQRSLSPRTTPSGSPRSPSSPKSPAGGSTKQQPEGEKKRTSFAENDSVLAEKEVAEIAEKTPTSPTSPSKPATPVTKTCRVITPAKLTDEKTQPKSSEKQAVQNGNKSESQATNGVAESPTKKSKDSDKRSTAGSPTKSPSKSAKSVPRTPETPSSIAQDKKKVPMNKVQVGAAPSPNLKTIRSKIGSLDNASYKPGGGKVKIENRKLDFSKAQPKIAAKNEKYTPSGGDKKIAQVKLQWNAKSKIGSLENTTYKPGGGDKKIETVKLDFKDKAKSKVGSKDNVKHMPGGGAVKSATPPKTPQEAKDNIPTQKVDIKAESKIGSLDNMKHKPGGGDKKIFNDRDYLRQTSSNVESLNGSGSQSPVPSGAITDGKNGLPASDENLNQEC